MNAKYKIISLVLFLFIIAFSYIPNNTFALSLLPPNNDTNLLLFGQQKHNYTVTFRGNGEAIVYAKITFTNKTEFDIKTFSFEAPKKIQINEIVSVQQVPYADYTDCTSYDATGNCVVTDKELTYNNGVYPYNNNTYNYQNNYYGNDSYLEATVYENGSKYSINLPRAVKPKQENSIIVAYTTFGYVKETLGLFKYEFKTLSVSDRISNVMIAIKTDSDLHLKGGKSNVNYNNSPSLSSMGDVKSGAMNSEAIGVISRNIGNYGSINKSATNLSPNETYSTKGTYATSAIRLYMGTFISFILFIAVVVGSALLFSRLWRKRSKLKQFDQVEKITKDTTSENVAPSVTKKETTVINEPQVVLDKNSYNFFGIKYFFAGLGSALSIVLISLSVELISKIFDYSYMNSFFVGVIYIITIFLSYILAIFGPAIYMATKRGWKGFLATLFFEFIWLVLFGIFFAIFVLSISNPSYNPIDFMGPL